jgi:lysophospholipase L1-like esterase
MPLRFIRFGRRAEGIYSATGLDAAPGTLKLTRGESGGLEQSAFESKSVKSTVTANFIPLNIGTMQRTRVKPICFLLLFAPFAAAQVSSPTPAPQVAPQRETNALRSPGAVPAPLPTPAQIQHMQQLLTDWPDLARYHVADATLPPPAPGENRVVFMGDSITDMWGRREKPFFPDKPYINRGISGQTTPQMLVRFWPDVIGLQPRVVVILAGTNDIAGNTGPSTPQMIEDNFMAMADLAKANHIRVILASILPAANYPWKPGIDPVGEIRTLNEWMRAYCTSNGYIYLDYYAAMAMPDGAMKPSLTIDGVHPNQAGYDVMAPLAERAISAALTTP